MRGGRNVSQPQSYGSHAYHFAEVLGDFTPTSNPELDSLLAKYREQLFIPSSLSKSHQRLIYRPTRHHYLTDDPGVSVTISEDEELKLQPMKLADRPRKKELPRALKLFGETDTDESWDNLYTFLQGLGQSRSVIHSVQLESIVRVAMKQGRYRVIMDCLEGAPETRLRLCGPLVTRQLLLGCHERAAAASFTGAEFGGAVKMVQQIVLLMEKPYHCAGKLVDGEFDMRQSLFTNAIVLEFLAADKFAKLRDIQNALSRVLTLSGATDTVRGKIELRMPEFDRHRRRKASYAQHEMGDLADRVEVLTPIYSALKFASKVPDAVEDSNKPPFEWFLGQVTNDLQADVRKLRSLTTASQQVRPLRIFNDVEKFHQR